MHGEQKVKLKWEHILYIENKMLYNFISMSDVMLVENIYSSI
jgi:hypothetical protein